ncbi:MAG: fumarylacetoacetate hydrolase family protein, partial [Chloroflexi bacterium]|nr:fumarylacetoacetate hydrolase family protein [Chloroflexota bacterium]
MRLVLFDDFRPGLLVDDQVVDVSEVVEAGRSTDGQALMEKIIRDFATLSPDLDRRAASGLRRPLVSVRLRAPLPRPPKILCLIGNYREGVDRPPRPIDMFVKASSTVIGPGDTIELPEARARVFQHEAELAVVIGR